MKERSLSGQDWLCLSLFSLSIYFFNAFQQLSWGPSLAHNPEEQGASRREFPTQLPSWEAPGNLSVPT